MPKTKPTPTARRTWIYLDEMLKRRVKAQSAHEGLTMEEWIKRAVEEQLEREARP